MIGHLTNVNDTRWTIVLLIILPPIGLKSRSHVAELRVARVECSTAGSSHCLFSCLVNLSSCSCCDFRIVRREKEAGCDDSVEKRQVMVNQINALFWTGIVFASFEIFTSLLRCDWYACIL